MKMTMTTLDAKWENLAWPGDDWAPASVDGSVVVALDDRLQADDIIEGGAAIDAVLDIAREAMEREDGRVEVLEWDVDVNLVQLRATCTPREWERKGI